MNKTRMLHMTPGQVIAHYKKRGLSVPDCLQKPKKAPKKPISDGYDSKLERMYAVRLQCLKRLKIIAHWKRNKHAYRYTSKHTYTPDFVVVTNEKKVILIELKGKEREDDVIKFDTTAEIFNHFRWIYLLDVNGKCVKTKDRNVDSAILPNEMI